MYRDGLECLCDSLSRIGQQSTRKPVRKEIWRGTRLATLRVGEVLSIEPGFKVQIDQIGLSFVQLSITSSDAAEGGSDSAIAHL